MSEAPVVPSPAEPNPVDIDPYTLSLDAINVAQGRLFQEDVIYPWFERLRNEAPVHYCAESEFGAYWSITRYDDIMYVDTHHKIFSSETGITIGDQDEDFTLPMFIAMDPPKHDVQRKTVQGVVSPRNLSLMEPLIRERAGKILDALPIGEEFNWVEHVSIELTTQMLATIFDFPRGPSQAHALVRRGNRKSRIRDHRVGRAAPRGAHRMPRILHEALERAGERGAGQ